MPRPQPVSPGSARGGLADLAGLAPAMALFGVFIVVPMAAALVLSLFRWNGLGTPHWAGGADWTQFARDPLARQALLVTGKVVVLSWVVQTPFFIALGLFTGAPHRSRSVYAA